MITFNDYMEVVGFIDNLHESFYAEFLDFLYESETEAEPLIERKIASGNMTQPWAKELKTEFNIANVDKLAPVVYKTIIDEYIEPIKKEYERALKAAAEKDCKVLVSIKSQKSFISKLNRGKKPERITDVIRGAILCPNDEIVQKVLRNLQKKTAVAEFETKVRGENDWGYWGAHHLLIELSNGVLAEIQVMTKTAWTYKDAAHQIYDKYREELSKNKNLLNDPTVQKEIKRSKMLFDRGFMGKKGIRV